MVTRTSIAVTQNVFVALEDNIPSRLNGCYIKMIEFSFETNGKCTKLYKNEKKELKNV